MATTADISKLRTMTGAGMMDCKQALDEAEGNLDKAAEILRKKGIVKAAKRADKTAAEGVVKVLTANNTAVVLELNSETDFVAKNDDFKKVVEELSALVLKEKPASVEDALKLATEGGKTVEEYITDATAKIGEKLSLRRLQVIEKSDSEVFGAYTHMGGKIVTLVVLTAGGQDLAYDIAMHAAAAAPKYLKSDQVPTEIIEKEKEVYTVQLKEQGKPENIIENILKGKINKYYEEVCLVDQAFVKDDKKKVKELLPEGAKIKEFVRYELGEGIAKKECDFVAEVAEQMG